MLHAGAFFVASSSATACAPAAPALLLRTRDRPRSAFIGSTNGLPLRWCSLGAPGDRPSLAAHRQLHPAALNCVANPATGFMPEAPRAIVASSTAPSACRLRYRSTRTTDSFRFPPSTWPAGQSERLAITLGIRLGLRVGRPPPPAHRRLPPADP